MKRGQLTLALDHADAVYNDIVVIADDIIKHYLWEIDSLIKTATEKDSLSNDDIRHLILQLSLKSYGFSEIKEKSALKVECAEALRKEKYALKFNETDGTVAYKENQATISSTDEILVEAIYSLVASLFKTKQDEIHRVVDSLKSILVSRNMEAKLSSELFE